MRIDSVVRQTRSYEPTSTFAQTTAATAATSRTTALPVSVRRKPRSGVSRFRTQAVRPVNGDSTATAFLACCGVLSHCHGQRIVEPLEWSRGHGSDTRDALRPERRQSHAYQVAEGDERDILYVPRTTTPI